MNPIREVDRIERQPMIARPGSHAAKHVTRHFPLRKTGRNNHRDAGAQSRQKFHPGRAGSPAFPVPSSSGPTACLPDSEPHKARKPTSPPIHANSRERACAGEHTRPACRGRRPADPSFPARISAIDRCLWLSNCQYTRLLAPFDARKTAGGPSTLDLTQPA